MNLNIKKNFKKFSLIGQRASFGLICLELAKNDTNFLILTADVSTSAGLDRFRKALPEQYIEVGISEQNLIGVASGLSSEGFNVMTTTFSPFQTLRCTEQIKVNLGYMKNKVILVGLASGLALGSLGYTHCSIEDISIIRSIPNITICSPADCIELYKILEASTVYKESIYIRLTGTSNQPIIYNDDYNFQIGKSIRLKEGKDIDIFANGPTVYESLEAAKILEESGISAGVINMHTIKPIDREAITKSCHEKKYIFSIEEHSIIGGLSSAIAEVKSSFFNSSIQISIALPDEYDKSGPYEQLKDYFGLTSQKIAIRIAKELENDQSR